MAKPGDEDTSEIASAILRRIVIPSATQIGTAADTGTSAVSCTAECSQLWTVEWYQAEVAKYNTAYDACSGLRDKCYADYLKSCDRFSGMERMICQMEARNYCANGEAVCFSKIPSPGGPAYLGDSKPQGWSKIAYAADLKFQACVKNCPK